MAADEPTFQAAVLVPSMQELQLQTVGLAVAAFPSKVGNQLMKALGPAAPLTDLRHLKRVRKAPDDGTLLEAVLCSLPDRQREEPSDNPMAAVSSTDTDADCTSPTSSTDLAPECLPGGLRDLYTQHGGLRLRLMHGAAVPPQTRQQWEAWTKLWPITWRIPDHGTPVTEETPVDARTQQYFEHHMRRALRLAAAAGADNAAVIVSPPALTPVAEAVDGSAVHPLQHAVMAAIQSASERDLALWPPAADQEPEGTSGTDGTGAAEAADGAEPHRQGLAATFPDAGEDGRCAPSAPDACRVEQSRKEHESVSGGGHAAPGEEELASKRPRLGEGPTEGLQAAAGPRPYMCTGYDCFVVMEPCIMCAMALVHSRVQRVIFCRPDPTHGALNGERRLHACRSLNHNYEVFRMELK